ncbi:MAG: methylmalonyl-CoA mutase family protein [Spirochaetota bacterium]|nr:methylmalonyl-CoA mutase family protein [Spirochaetota bacterium]
MENSNASEDVKVLRWREKPTRLETFSDISVKESYGPEDLKETDYYRDIGAPGEYPYTRGIHSNMYRGKIWTRRLFCGVGSPSFTNKRLKYQIERGASGIIISPDMACNMDIEPDHPLASGFVALQGAPIYCGQDTDAMFEGIDLTSTSIAFQWCDSSALFTLACFIATAQKRGYDISKLRGSIINDPLHQYFGWYTGGQPYSSPQLKLKINTDIVEFCANNIPFWHPVVLNSYDVSQSGTNTFQEVGFGFALAKEYLRSALKRGIDINKIGSRIMHVYTSNMDFFETIAKFRAVRRMWAKMMKEEFGATDLKACRAFITTHTDGYSLTYQQPANNIVRISLETMAAVLGGVQSTDPCGYDEPYCIPSHKAALMSLNIQNVIAYETGVVNAADPLGGSYYVEHLTNAVEEGINEYLKKIEDMGGIIKTIENGWAVKEVNEAKLKRDMEIEEKKRVIVGLNELTLDEEEWVPVDIDRDTWLDDISGEEYIESLNEFKKNRNISDVKDKLNALHTAATKGDNLMPATIDSVNAGVTLAEVLGVIREANGLKYDPYGMVENPFNGRA